MRLRSTFPRFLGLLPVLLLAAAAGSVSPGAAQTARPAGTALAAAGIRETVLPNGLKVITKEVHSAPVAHFAVWYRVGSRNEHTGITGVSHLLEHLMFKGTRKYGLGEISRTLFVNGATFNAGTSYDYTNYWATLAADRMDLAIEIEADRMTGSLIRKQDLDSEMTVVRSELEGGENSPDRLLSQAVSAAAFQAHPYQWPVIGWRTDVENVSRDAIYRYYRTYYGPNNAAIVAVGDFNTAQLLEKIRRAFGSIPRVPTPPRVYTQEPPQRGERRVTVRRAGALPQVSLAYKSPPARSADFYALDTLATLLSTGRTSRLYQNLVEKQVATDISAGAPSLRDAFLFSLDATAAPGVTAEKLEEALLAEVERLKTEPVSAEELARAKTQIETDFVFRNDSVSAQGQQIGYWETAVDSWRYLATYVDRVKALTPADLQRVAQKYFVPETRTVGHFIPTEQGTAAGPPPREASARVEKAKRGDRPVPLPRPLKAGSASRGVTRFRLDNGLSVVVQQNRTNPTVALRGSLPAGAVLEPREQPGLAAVTAAMLSRGAAGRSAFQFAAALEDMGASLSAGADTLAANFTGRAQSRDFEKLIDLFADMLRQPAFPATSLQRLKSQFLAGLAQAKTDPDSLAARAFERAIFPENSPLRPETLEEAERAVAAITREDVEGFYRRQYGPDRMIVVLAGDVDPARVRTALEARLGDWAKNAQARPLPELEVPLAAKAERISIHVPDKSETAILFGHAGLLKRSDPDFYAAQLMNLILGGGGALNSRLGNVIRDEQGLAYTVFSFFDSSLYPGPFQVSLGTNPANAAKAIASLEAQVRRMRERGVTRRELDEAVAYQTGRFPQRLETNAGMAEVLWVAEFFKLGSDYIDRYGDYYRAVTVEELNQAAKRHLHPDRATLVVAGTLPEK